MVLYIEGGTSAQDARKWVPRKIYAPKRDEVIGSRGMEKTICCGNTIWVIKSRRMQWAGACSM